MDGRRPLLQCCGSGNDLENGTGLVNVRDRFILPLLFLRRLLGSLLFLAVGHGGNSSRRLLVGNGKGIVQVEPRLGGHGQNIPGVHVHDDPRRALQRHMLSDSGVQRFL